MPGRRPRRMTSKQKRLAIVAAAATLVIYLGWDMVGDIGAAPVSHRPQSTVAATVHPTSSPTSAVTSAPPPNVVSYAVAVREVAGLPPDVPPGTTLDLWVAWDPPVTKKPRLQSLLQGVVLETIAPPVTPDGSAAALFHVPRRDVDRLIWADRYGSLSATIVSRT